ncbi:glycosyltransferase family 2 protein [Candidatus Omnitrophota bacterium]
MWKGRKVSVALPAYSEKDSIRDCIEGFFKTGVVDEVVVCNNNAIEGTSQEIAKTKAREVFEERQGYGWSCQKALAETTGDLIMLSEPDGTFEPNDIFKLLAYSDDFQVVLGSRTNSELIWQGANMGWFLKWGNWAVAKYVELIFNAPSLTDVGCTARLLSREILTRIQPFFTVGKGHFGLEMMLLCILSRGRMIELPLNYKARKGESSVTGKFSMTLAIGFRMIFLALTYRLRSWFTGRYKSI